MTRKKDGIKRIAIFPCGSEIGLEIYNALRFERTLELYGLSSVNCHGQTIYQNYTNRIPWFKDPDFFERLNAYLDENEVDILFPAYDDIVEFLADNREKLHCTLAAPSAEVCGVARSKAKTYDTLAGCDFVPKVYADAKSIDQWPAFAKPDRGQGSQGVMRLDGPESVSALGTGEGYIFSEYLPGTEYTVDCFSDAAGVLKLCQPRERMRMKAGISVRTRAVPLSDEILAIGNAIQALIPFRGAWFFQIKYAQDGRLKLLEVAPRIGGSMGLTRNLGANLPLLTVWDLLGKEVTVAPIIDDRIVDRYLGNRYTGVPYFERVYLDYDDTVTCRGMINSAVMSFIYNCRNRGIQIVLITRFDGDIAAELQRRGIAAGLFEEIIHITDKSPKSGHIRPEGAIFIDDSFAERLEVTTQLGIPVHAPDAIESLIDWRVL